MSKDGAGPGLAYSETRSASSEEVRKLKARVKKLNAALKEAVEALRFYSSNDHWFGPSLLKDGKRLFNKIQSEDCHPVTSPERFVGGKMARKTLARIEEVLK